MVARNFKLGAWAGTQKLGIEVKKYRLGAWGWKYKLRNRTEGRRWRSGPGSGDNGKDWGLENMNTHNKEPERCYMTQFLCVCC